MNKKRFSFLLFSLSLQIGVAAEPVLSSQSEAKIRAQTSTSLERLRLNFDFSAPNRLGGLMVASPTREHPPYFYHWTRDAALVMTSLHLIKDSPSFQNNGLMDNFAQRLRENVAVEMRLEKLDYGQAKFTVDGYKFEGWPGPQNDGPAFRVLTYINYLENQATQNNRDFNFENDVRKSIVDNLKYLSAALHHADVEPWEEITGFHFFNRLVFAKAFQRARDYFERTDSNDELRGLYNGNLDLLFRLLGHHVVTRADRVVPSLGVQNPKGKHSDLDVSVLLGVLYTDFPEFKQTANGQELSMSFFPDNDQLQNSVAQLISSFQDIYSINHRGLKGVLIGRYPEDIYDGYNVSEGETRGNPWILSTLALGEYYSRLYVHLKNKNSLSVTTLNSEFYKQVLAKSVPTFDLKLGIYKSDSDEFKTVQRALREQAIAQIERVLYHTPTDGNLPEQFNRETGFAQGANELSWSHAQFLRSRFYLEEILK